MKPIVDGLEAELAGQLTVVRLDIQNTAHRAAVEQFRVLGTPTFILLDAQGVEIWRGVGVLDAQAVRGLAGVP